MNGEGEHSIPIHPKEIKGAWDVGFVLDVHTISSTMIGYNEFGYPEFDTQRSPLGELVYRLKYKNDNKALDAISETIATFVIDQESVIDAIVPMPPSKSRAWQPVMEIASQLTRLLNIALDATSLRKTKVTAQMKDIGDFSERAAVLREAFSAAPALAGKRILLIDDLFQSGATMNVAADTLKNAGVSFILAIALTRTRG
jgi:competence protein ComFC